MATKLTEAAYWELQDLIANKIDGSEDHRKQVALNIVNLLNHYNIVEVKFDNSTPDIKYSNLEKIKQSHFNGYNYF